MNRLLRDAWVLLGLAFGQMLLSFVFVTLVPLGYLSQKAHSNEEIRALWDEMSAFLDDTASVDLTGQQLLEQKGATIGKLVKVVPWTSIALCGTLLIYPFLGWWSSRLLYQPQLGGLLVLGSVLSQQNVVMLPRQIEYWNVATVSLNLPTVLLLIALQFVLFTVGIMVQRGQSRLSKSNSEEKTE
jgi:hypothetical protein